MALNIRTKWASTLALLLGLIGSNASASLTLTGPLGLTHTGNLIVNGSFEIGTPGLGYWANGTTRGPAMAPPGWTSSGDVNNYAYWSNWGSVVGSDTFPDGPSGLYFGNLSPLGISETPTFNANGTVSFTATPTFTPTAGYGQPVALNQTISVIPGDLYGLSFWVSGEDAAFGGYGHDGFFGLSLTGNSTLYLACPDDTSSPLGAISYVYNFTFVPTTSSVTLSFLNYGHMFAGYTAGWTLPSTSELVLDDVIVNHLGSASVPEPGQMALLVGFSLSSGMLLLRHRKRRV